MNVVSLNNVSLDGNIIRKGASGGGGNQGILIVESVDRLDINAPVGSLAVVAQQAGIGKIDLNNIHTLTEEDLDADAMELLNVEKFTPVSSVNFLTPTDLTNLTQSTIVFLPKTFSGTSNLKMLAFTVMPEGVMFAYQDFTKQSGIESGEYTIGAISDNIYTIDQSVASILENVLNSDEWIIGGSENTMSSDGSIPPEQIEVLNRFFEFYGGVPAYANLYIKKDQWEDVVSALFNEVENVKDRISNTEYKIINGPSTNITIKPNTMYVWNTVNYLNIALADPIPDIVNEYIIQFKSNSSGTTTITLPSYIKLSEELEIESNCIYQISIVNNLATVLKWEA